MTAYCGERSKLLVPAKPDSYMICTQDKGHPPGEHSACDGMGHILAQWSSPTSKIKVWLPGRGMISR